MVAEREKKGTPVGVSVATGDPIDPVVEGASAVAAVASRIVCVPSCALRPLPKSRVGSRPIPPRRSSHELGAARRGGTPGATRREAKLRPLNGFAQPPS